MGTRGQYVRKVGSQFGSIRGFDGPLAAEATPERYTAFGAAPDTKLCHSQDINWLGRKWSVILACRRHNLAQVSAYTEYDEELARTTVTWLTSLLGNSEESPSESSWVGRDGLIILTKTPKYARRFRMWRRTDPV